MRRKSTHVQVASITYTEKSRICFLKTLPYFSEKKTFYVFYL